MNSAWFLELATSLSLQVVLVIVATFFITRIVRDPGFVGLAWAAMYVVLLGLVFAALLLPHPRWIPRIGGALNRPAATELLTVQIMISRVLFGVWLAGAMGLWMWMLAQSVRVARFLKTCRELPLDHPALLECRMELDKTLKSGPVLVLSSPSIAGPFCWQFHRPQIVLPDFLLGLDPGGIRFIVRHELAHLRTGHPLQLFLQRMVEVVFWFHPLIWLAAQQVSRSREFNCDDSAIDRPAEIAAYLRTLLIVVEHGAVESEQRSPVLAFGRGTGVVAERARRLAEISRFGWPSPSSQRRCMSTGLSWIAIVIGCLGLWLPIDLAVSSRSTWSPWPRWSANVLREFGIMALDFEVYDDRIELHEMLEHDE